MTDRFTGRAHLDPADLQHLAARPDEALARTLEAVLDHLARRCPTCRLALDRYPRHRLLERARGDHVAALDRAKRRILDLARERDEARALVPELLALPTVPRAVATLAANPRYATWGVASLLTDRAITNLDDDPHTGHHHALLATAAAESLPADGYTPGLRATTRALARIAFATTRLVAHHDLPAAQRELDRAAAEASAASDRPLVQTELTLTRMRVHLATEEWQRAIDAFTPTERACSRNALPDRHAQALLLLGRAHRGVGDLHAALGTFRVLQSLAKAKPELDTLARWAALEGSGTLCTLRRYDEALDEMERIHLGAPAPERFQGHAAWTRARSLRGLGRTSEAEAELEEARAHLTSAGDGLAAVLVLLDARELLRAEGRTADASRLVRQGVGEDMMASVPSAARLILHRLAREIRTETAWTDRTEFLRAVRTSGHRPAVPRCGRG